MSEERDVSGQDEHDSVGPRPQQENRDALDRLDLQACTVHTVVASPSSVAVLLDVPSEPCLRPGAQERPEASPRRPGALLFNGVSELAWHRDESAPGRGERSDRLLSVSRRRSLRLGDDVLDLVAEGVRLVLDGGDVVRSAAPPPRLPDPARHEGLGTARVNSSARRQATSMALGRVEGDGAGRRFWARVVETALEAIATRPLDPPLAAWPFPDDDGQIDHSTLGTFSDVHLADSHLFTVVALPGTVAFLLDAAILSSSPYWREPPPGEWATWLPSTLRFTGVTGLRWIDAHQPPAFDADLEKDYGTIDSLTYRDRTYRIDSGAGILEITAMTVDLDVHPRGRPPS